MTAIHSTHHPATIEIIGIPYSGKTTLIYGLSSRLSGERHSFDIVHEYKGGAEFFAANKTRPELNFARLLHVAGRLTEFANSPSKKDVLVDRGIIDSLAWLQWFAENGEQRPILLAAAEAVVEAVLSQPGRYYVIWLSADPLAASARSSKHGRITNLATLVSLEAGYNAFSKQLKNRVRLIKISPDTENKDPHSIVERVLDRTKLLRDRQA